MSAICHIASAIENLCDRRRRGAQRFRQSFATQFQIAIQTMSLPRTDTPLEQFADSDAVTTVSLASVLTLDDSWLEAVLDHLALAKLSRREGVALLRKLDDLEQEMTTQALSRKAGAVLIPIVVGDHFDAELNAHDMRAPGAMTADNVLETIDRAARHFVAEGHAAALRQLAFFISGNLEEVLRDEDGDED
jgi:hypothetical protein